MRRNTVLFAALACCSIGAAQAADPVSWSYWEAAYLNSSRENTSTSGSVTEDKVEGFRAAASVGLARYVNFVADYDQRRYANSRDAFGAIGLGVHTRNPEYQFFGNATWERLELDFNQNPSADRDEEGWGAELGARYALRHLALQAAFKYVDYGEVGNGDLTSMRYGIGGALALSPWWALVADYRVRELNLDIPLSGEATDEFNEWTVGFRRYFPTQADPRRRKDGVLFGEDAAQ